jgi:hypothetical protein
VFDVKILDREFISYKTMSWGDIVVEPPDFNDLKNFMNDNFIYYQAYSLDYFVKDSSGNFMFRFPELCFYYKDASSLVSSGDLSLKIILKRIKKK